MPQLKARKIAHTHELCLIVWNQVHYLSYQASGISCHPFFLMIAFELTYNALIVPNTAELTRCAEIFGQKKRGDILEGVYFQDCGTNKQKADSN